MGKGILKYYEQSNGTNNNTILDLCCGTGTLLLNFAENSYQGMGIDISADMLAVAKENLDEYRDKVKLVERDVTEFEVTSKYDLFTSTADALNHLPDLNALESCFKCVKDAITNEGLFIFDINTPGGITRGEGMALFENESVFVLRNESFEQLNNKGISIVYGMLVSDLN
ncbi:class I SAM-dependent DNA methyltransferase [Pontibacillus litoralis]|uniref:Methyltransferase domain-containing protein n=1 Tax=Pontibacillus litoralis JSM 072002 TaxID=1385512 RepID=A0A0A5G0G1_9BACI|nr:class I SAM-dependent methyltransferase [Pontibacillus litoralis]KGX84588.1 hypothetical protein N784_13140 [Pontibacillus litoralis JSM 072002]